MKILNALEREAFDSPPRFNSVERKRFFDFPLGIHTMAEEMRSPTNRVCFLVSYGYFKATRKFFAGPFHGRDIAYVALKLGLELNQIESRSYPKQTYLRHQKIILDFSGFSAFDDTAQAFIGLEIEDMTQAHFKPRLIFSRAVERLIREKVSPPSYDALSKLILRMLNQHKKHLGDVIEAGLSLEVRELLDRLLEKVMNDDNEPINRYRLTLLKKGSQSTRPGKIKESVEDFEHLRTLYQAVQPSLDALGLPLEAVRYYANSVIRSEIFQVSRRSAEDRYIHLIAFIAHQYFRLQDNLVDIYLSTMQSSVNTVHREHREKCYALRASHNESLKSLLVRLDESFEMVSNIDGITKDRALRDREKLQRIERLVEEATGQKHRTETLRDEIEEDLHSADYFVALEGRSTRMQNRAAPLLKTLTLHGEPGSEPLLEALDYFKEKDGMIDRNAPHAFLKTDEREAVYKGEFRISLYKALLFIHVMAGLKSGTLNLTQSYKYRSLDDYLIARDGWENDKVNLLARAGLADFSDPNRVLEGLDEQLHDQYLKTNRNLQEGVNDQVTFSTNGSFRVKTPKAEENEADPLQEVFPERQYIPLSEVLATVDHYSGYLDDFQHWQQRYNRTKPARKNFIAGLSAIGCDIGLGKILKIARDIDAAELENTVNWYFYPESLHAVNDRLLQFMDGLELPNLYRNHSEVLHTASDGQKFEVRGDSLNANYSFKYFGKGSGISVYSFIDERHLLFFSTVISAAERESAYVIDGLMHNDVVKSDIHSTDTHGYTEAIFGAMHLLGFSYAPRIKNLKKQRLYSFKSRQHIDRSGWTIKPSGYIDTELIVDNWDDILRFIATIKLKETTASDLFRRLNSYSKQHTLYRALKAFGKILKSIFILRYIDDVELRQAIERQLNKIESAHRFSRAISVGNPQEMIQTEKEEQEIAEACKRAIKNAIVCWNYLYLTQRIADEKDPDIRENLLDRVTAGSVVSWQHINLLGEYDFSDEKLQDSVGIKAPKILGLQTT